MVVVLDDLNRGRHESTSTVRETAAATQLRIDQLALYMRDIPVIAEQSCRAGD